MYLFLIQVWFPHTSHSKETLYLWTQLLLSHIYLWQSSVMDQCLRPIYSSPDLSNDVAGQVSASTVQNGRPSLWLSPRSPNSGMAEMASKGHLHNKVTAAGHRQHKPGERLRKSINAVDRMPSWIDCVAQTPHGMALESRYQTTGEIAMRETSWGHRVLALLVPIDCIIHPSHGPLFASVQSQKLLRMR
jgi:hypothetical protein